ncbi:MAG: hypothetical protein KGZ69_03355 [Methylomonas sp.]|nr:hypothetical protein [Methylomonas sp.]
MASYGAGIGAFINGLASGANVARQWDKQDQEQRFKERQLGILESANKRAESKDARDAANDAQDRQWAAEDRAIKTPVIAAQSRSILSGLADVEAEKEAKKSAGAEANKAFSENPAKYNNNFDEAFNSVYVPKVRQFYLSKGDTANADAFTAWTDKKEVKDAVKTVGGISQALTVGDWDKAINNINSTFNNKDYIFDTGWKRAAEPVKDKDGKTVGMRFTSTSPDGNKTGGADITDAGDASVKSMSMLSPHTAYEFAKSAYDRKVAEQAETNKSTSKLANDIVLDRMRSHYKMDEREQDSALKIIEESAKRDGFDPKEVTNQALNLLKTDMENGNPILGTRGKDGKIVPPSGGEALRLATDKVIETRRSISNQQSAATGSTPQGGMVNPGRVLRRDMGAQPVKPFNPGISRAM